MLVLTVGKLGLSGFPWAWQLLAAAFGFLNLSSRETLLCKGGRITDKCVQGATGEVGELDME